MLFLTNLIGIIAVAISVFASTRYGEWKRALLALLIIVGLSSLLILPPEHSLHRLYVKNRVVRLVAKLAYARPDIISGRVKFESIHVTYREGLLHVHIDGFVPRDLLVDKPGEPDTKKRVDLFQEYPAADIGEPVQVEFDVIAVDMIELGVKRPAPQIAEQHGIRK